MGFSSGHHSQSRGLGADTDLRLFTMEVEYVEARIREAQRSKQKPHGTNPDCQERYVYLRYSLIKNSWAGRKGHFPAKLARFPPVAHWLIEVRSIKSEPGLCQGNKLAARVSYRSLGRQTPVPRQIKVSERKKARKQPHSRDEEIDDLGEHVDGSSDKNSKDTVQVRATTFAVECTRLNLSEESTMSG